MTLDEPTLALARVVISSQQPLGPPDATEIAANTDLLRLLYDPTNRIHRQAESSGAPFVIGRKGAGKTAFVMAPKLSPQVRAVELPSADLYQGVFGILSQLLARKVNVFAEHTAELWRHLVWCAVLSDLAGRAEATGLADQPGGADVVAFARALGEGRIPRSPQTAVDAYLTRVMRMIDDTAAIGGLGALLNSVVADGRTIGDAIDAGRTAVAASPERIVVIVDSLERYGGALPTPNLLTPEGLTFEGLFRFVGSDGNRADRSFDIRFAFPAELWPVLSGASSAPNKDFHQRVVAHWSARELIILMGTRLSIFGLLHQPDLIAGLGIDLNRSGPLDYETARRVLDRFLPPTVTSALGVQEDTLAYLLRHTQLLPRHVITLANRIWEAQRHLDPGRPLPVSARAVVEGVRNGEAEIVDDVLASFSSVHPSARECCERTLANLGMAPTTSELQKQYNYAGIRKHTGLQFNEFRSMLSDIGAIGRVIDDRSTDRYLVAEFDYTRAGSLHLGFEDRPCIHPIFAEVFSCRHAAARLTMLPEPERREIRAVYPYGCDPEVDHRDL